MRKLFAFLCALLLVGCSSLPWTTQHTHTDANGITYTGQWKYGMANGQGTMTHANGGTYKGEWKGGTRHGRGTYTGADGITYTGAVKDGRTAR